MTSPRLCVAVFVQRGSDNVLFEIAQAAIPGANVGYEIGTPAYARTPRRAPHSPLLQHRLPPTVATPSSHTDCGVDSRIANANYEKTMYEYGLCDTPTKVLRTCAMTSTIVSFSTGSSLSFSLTTYAV